MWSTGLTPPAVDPPAAPGCCPPKPPKRGLSPGSSTPCGDSGGARGVPPAGASPLPLWLSVRMRFSVGGACCCCCCAACCCRRRFMAWWSANTSAGSWGNHQQREDVSACRDHLPDHAAAGRCAQTCLSRWLLRLQAQRTGLPAPPPTLHELVQRPIIVVGHSCCKHSLRQACRVPQRAAQQRASNWAVVRGRAMRRPQRCASAPAIRPPARSGHCRTGRAQHVRTHESPPCASCSCTAP